MPWPSSGTRQDEIGENEQDFTHPALIYQGPREYLTGTAPFILQGIAADDPVTVAVPAPRLRLLRDALGAVAERITLLDMTVAGRNPGRIIAEVLLAAADAHRDRHARIIGEPLWPERSEIEYPACMQHEALINLAFRGRHATILCPYDLAGLHPIALADAAATHPTLIQGGRTRPSPDYAPQRILSAYNRPFPARRTLPSSASTPIGSPVFAVPRPITPATPAWAKNASTTSRSRSASWPRTACNTAAAQGC